jgi:hypothetical protein
MFGLVGVNFGLKQVGSGKPLAFQVFNFQIRFDRKVAAGSRNKLGSFSESKQKRIGRKSIRNYQKQRVGFGSDGYGNALGRRSYCFQNKVVVA